MHNISISYNIHYVIICHVLTHQYRYCRTCSPVSRMIALCTCYKKRSQKEHQIRIYDVGWSTCAMLAEATGSNSNSRKMSWKSHKCPTLKNWIIRLRISPKRPSSLEVFPKLSLYKWAKVGCHHAPMDFFWFRLGLDSIPTNIISHTIIIISPRASLLHSFQCLWAHNPSKDLQKTILSSRKNKKKTCSFQSQFFKQKLSRPEVSSNDPSKPERKLEWKTTSSMEVPWCFMKAAPRLRPKELQPYLPTTDLPSQTNRPMPWYATMPLPSLHSCYEFFAFVPGKVGQWIETEILKKSCGA